MKMYLGILTLVVVLVSAFTLKSGKSIPPKKQVSLYWFVGTSYTGRQNTHAAEVSPSGCPDSGSLHCEDGYDGSDFNVQGDPNSGLKSGATINDFIRKS